MKLFLLLVLGMTAFAHAPPDDGSPASQGYRAWQIPAETAVPRFNR